MDPISRSALSWMMHPGRFLQEPSSQISIPRIASKSWIRVDTYGWLHPLRKLIMDHGSEFGAHRVHEDGTWNGDFKKHLEEHGIKPILGSVAHPQTNGKLERFFQEYKRHRAVFHSIDDFIGSMNNSYESSPKRGEIVSGFHNTAEVQTYLNIRMIKRDMR
jgi:transposase InsO family protein